MEIKGPKLCESCVQSDEFMPGTPNCTQWRKLEVSLQFPLSASTENHEQKAVN